MNLKEALERGILKKDIKDINKSRKSLEIADKELKVDKAKISEEEAKHILDISKEFVKKAGGLL